MSKFCLDQPIALYAWRKVKPLIGKKWNAK